MDSIHEIIEDGKIRIQHGEESIELPLQVVLHAADYIRDTYRVGNGPDVPMPPEPANIHA